MAKHYTDQNFTGGTPGVSLRTLRSLGSPFLKETLLCKFHEITLGTAISDGQMRLICLDEVMEPTQIAGGVFYMHTTGNYVSDFENGIALYKVNGSNYERVAVSGNNGELWKAAPGYVQQAFTQPYAAQPGVYFLALLYNSTSQVTQPLLGSGSVMMTGNNALIGGGIKLSGVRFGQNEIPVSVAGSDVSSQANRIWGGVY